jgi:hypothetical protein
MKEKGRTADWGGLRFNSREVMVETEAVMEKIYRVMEIPPDPPFSKGGNVLLFSETCRHAAEDSLRISPPFTKGGPGGI